MIIVAVILWISVKTVVGNCCEGTWIGYNNSCYLFFGNKDTWFEANLICHNHNAELASIQSAEEDLFIKAFLNEFAKLGADMTTWLGGTDMEIEGIWKWSTGEKVNYTDWYPGQPDGGDCLFLWPHDKTTGYTWGDSWCHLRYSFLCEKRLPTDPVVG